MILDGLLVKCTVYRYNILIMHVVMLGIKAKTYSSISSTFSILLVNIVVLQTECSSVGIEILNLECAILRPGNDDFFLVPWKHA